MSLKNGQSNFVKVPHPDKPYQFKNLQSGLCLHGGRLNVEKNATYHNLNQPYTAFVLLLSGTIRFAINKNYYEISAGKEGCCILISLDCITLFSRYLNKGDSIEKITISGLQQWLEHDELYTEHVRTWTLDTKHKNATQKLLDNDYSPLEKDALSISLISECWKYYGQPLLKNTKKSNPQYSKKTSTKYKHRLLLEKKMSEALERGMHESADIASDMNMSLRTLQRKVKLYCDCSIHQWRQEIIMRKALTALGEEQLSIGETAFLCGYKQSSNFIQAFRKYYGITPGELFKNSF